MLICSATITTIIFISKMKLLFLGEKRHKMNNSKKYRNSGNNGGMVVIKKN